MNIFRLGVFLIVCKVVGALMINYISKKMVDRLLRKEMITQEDYEIYLFGLSQFLVTLLDVLTCIAVGIVLDSLLQTILFLLAFTGIRSYAGGYHASTPLRCYALTILMITLSVVTLKYIEWNVWILSGLLVVASIVILILAPVDTENKPIDDVEYVYFRKMTIKVLAIEVVLAMVCIVLRFEIGAESIVGALVVLAAALWCEKRKKRTKRKNGLTLG